MVMARELSTENRRPTMPDKKDTAKKEETKAKKQPDLKDKSELSDEQLDQVSGGIEQVPTIGSQSKGDGAGKVTFNPFGITRKSD
jgi:bacteriocin-like protein